jgi:pyruvate/2-oxoglutarate dehydrogenase complex dihydrolipoamide dehydrogenase (E3) component
MTHDLIIIGGGSGGYAAARTAHEEGANVGIIDPGPLGGLCILRGCMPTKTILRSSDVMSLMKRAQEFGLEPVKAKANLSAIIDRKAKLINSSRFSKTDSQIFCDLDGVRGGSYVHPWS